MYLIVLCLLCSCTVSSAAFDSAAYVNNDFYLMFRSRQLQVGLDNCIKVSFEQKDDQLFYIIKSQNRSDTSSYTVSRLPAVWTAEGFSFTLNGNNTVTMLDTDYKTYGVQRMTTPRGTIMFATMKHKDSAQERYALLLKYKNIINETTIEATEIVNHCDCKYN